MKAQLKKKVQLQTRGWFYFGGVVLLLSLLFVLSLYAPVDPDLGWHLRNGQDILANGWINYGDLYSHPMFGYPWVAHEWLQDIFLYFTYTNLGPIFLVFLYALIIPAIFFLAASALPKVHLPFRLLAALLAILAAAPILGVRAQIATLAGVAFLFYILFRFRAEPGKKLYLLYFLPLLFLFWVNLHAGFIVGFAVLALFLLGEAAKLLRRKWGKATVSFFETPLTWGHLLYLSLISFISFLVTFINPYLHRVYVEIYQTLADEQVRQIIVEWFRITTSNIIARNFFIAAVLIALLIIFAWRKLDLTMLLLSVSFFFLALSGYRHMGLFVIVSLPLLVAALEGMGGRVLSNMLRTPVVLILLALALIILAPQQYRKSIALSVSEEKLADASGQPYRAVEYLREHPDYTSGNMFNPYNQGGWLVWYYPEKKVFIDGRMAIWRKPDQNILREHSNLISAQAGTEDLLKKYEIGFALITRGAPLRGYLISQLNWQEVYSDPNFVVIIRETKNTEENV